MGTRGPGKGAGGRTPMDPGTARAVTIACKLSALEHEALKALLDRRNEERRARGDTSLTLSSLARMVLVTATKEVL